MKDFLVVLVFWKMNDSLLEKKQNLDVLNDKIDKTVDRTFLYEKCFRWEQVKDCIVKTCKTISIENAAQARRDFDNISKRLEQATERLNTKLSSVETEATEAEIAMCNSELNVHIQRRIDGARTRSQIKWYEQGECSSKYFFRLEKVKYQNKTLKAVMREDNSITHDERQILAEQAKFYRKLYTSNPKIHFELTNHTDIKYDDVDKELLDAPFTFQDFTNALKSMKKGKAPGNDGLTVSVYIVLWTRIGRILWEAVEKFKENGYLYRSARRGIISLIPKKSKDPLFLKNWRPLMLLNSDHKIVTKMLTNRLKTHLKTIIGQQQFGYVPGRFIGLNLRKITDIIQFLECKGEQAVLLSIDYFKCFDSVEHGSMIQALRYFNIGENFIEWVLMFIMILNFALLTMVGGPDIINNHEAYTRAQLYRVRCFYILQKYWPLTLKTTLK